MKAQTIILPVEHKYLDKLSAYPVGRSKIFLSDKEKFIKVIKYFFHKGITYYIVIGKDLWKYIGAAKLKFSINIIAGGEIDSIEDAKKAFRLGADSIVVARHFYKNKSLIKK